MADNLKSRSNTAHNCKDSILVEAKGLLKTLHRCVHTIPNMYKKHSAFTLMMDSAVEVVKEFHLGREYKDDRVLHIKRMTAHYAVIVAMVEECDDLGCMPKNEIERICRHLDRMQEGIRKWKSSAQK